MLNLIKIFLIFTKVGAILIGGGYVILPILMNEFVEKRHLITHDELIDYYALSQSLPGIVAVNISLFIGYRIGKIFGALVAILGIILCPFLCIVILASLLGKIVNNNYAHWIFWGIGISVIALIMLTIRELWRNVERDLFFYLMFGLSLILLIVFKISPIQTILSALLLGVFVHKFIGDKA